MRSNYFFKNLDFFQVVRENMIRIVLLRAILSTTTKLPVKYLVVVLGIVIDSLKVRII